jgi:hypothetical protein
VRSILAAELASTRLVVWELLDVLVYERAILDPWVTPARVAVARVVHSMDQVAVRIGDVVTGVFHHPPPRKEMWKQTGHVRLWKRVHPLGQWGQHGCLVSKGQFLLNHSR